MAHSRIQEIGCRTGTGGKESRRTDRWEGKGASAQGSSCLRVSLLRSGNEASDLLRARMEARTESRVTTSQRYPVSAESPAEAVNYESLMFSSPGRGSSK